MSTEVQKLEQAIQSGLACVQNQAARLDAISFYHTERILNAFRTHRVSDTHFRATSGYAYSDVGRDALEIIFADLWGAEKALVRTQFVSGTHALAASLFGVLRPGDELLSVTGAPYDTMQTVIGHSVQQAGSLAEYGISYREVPFTTDGDVDLPAVLSALTTKTRVALIQRSRGYSSRNTLSVDQIGKICAAIKEKAPHCITFVDNCYGEFVEKQEPTQVGADLMAGSLIKNAGGGLAPTGGYIVGKAELVDQAAFRLTAPGLGGELGATLGDSARMLYQGLFLAPHVVNQAIRSAIFAAGIFAALGYDVAPLPTEERLDIIQSVTFGSPEKVIAFCQALQQWSPVDAFARPEPWDMPGYEDQIIMAAGTFVQGASIELSADAPIRPPYTAYLQGGLTFEHSRLALEQAAKAVL